MKRVALVLALLISLVPLEPIANATLFTEDQCLANVIYYEARGETLDGKRAVLDTVENRMAASGKNACQVMLQKRQFSWTHLRKVKPYDESMERMLTEVKFYPKILINENYLYFYSGLRPRWTINMDCKKLGGHWFCKERRNGKR